MKHLGKTLKLLVESQPLTKKDVASLIGVSPQYLSKMFSMESFDCSLLDKICKLLNVSPMLFFEDAYASDANVCANNSIIASTNCHVGNVSNTHDLMSKVEQQDRIIKLLLKNIDELTNKSK